MEGGGYDGMRSIIDVLKILLKMCAEGVSANFFYLIPIARGVLRRTQSACVLNF